MAAPGCTTSCTCVFADDGIVRIGDSYVMNSGKGRRNTVVSGQGSIQDPYTVSFIDSEFYRPDAGEYNFADHQSTIELEILSFSPDPPTVIYETPGVVFTGLTENFSPISPIRGVKGFFQVVGASAEFSADTTGVRKLMIVYLDAVQHIIASNTVDAGAETQTLSCTGFNPGRFAPVGVNQTGFPNYMVRVFQNTGGTLQLTRLKFWMGSL